MKQSRKQRANRRRIPVLPTLCTVAEQVYLEFTEAKRYGAYYRTEDLVWHQLRKKGAFA
jgi:hypothetical protein